MVVQPNLDEALAAAGRTSSGIDPSQITGMTWKGFTTATPVSDKGEVGAAVQVRVELAAKGAASSPRPPRASW